MLTSFLLLFLILVVVTFFVSEIPLRKLTFLCDSSEGDGNDDDDDDKSKNINISNKKQHCIRNRIVLLL